MLINLNVFFRLTLNSILTLERKHNLGQMSQWRVFSLLNQILNWGVGIDLPFLPHLGSAVQTELIVS